MKYNKSLIFRISGIWIYIFAIVVLGSIVVVHIKHDTAISNFTRDQAVVLNGTPFDGILSNIGILFWAWTVAILFNHYIVLTKIDCKRVFSKFIFMSGIITLILLFDDFFMFHDWIFPKYFGVYEKYFILFYGVYILIYLIKYRYFIFQSNYSLLLIACFFFVISIIIDRFPYSLLGEWHHLFEDGSKFVGIIFWFNYYSSLIIKDQVELMQKVDK